MDKEQIQGVGGREGCVQQVQYLLEISGLGPPLENNIIPWTPLPPTLESVHGLWVVFFFKEIFQEFMWTCRHQSKLLLYFTSLLYLYYFEFFVLLRSAMKSSYKKKLVLKDLIWWNHNPCINLELPIFYW